MKTQREGWLGDDYVRIYAENDRARVSHLYGFERSLPGYEPWGSWGLDALCLGPNAKFYLIDWIPLVEEFKRERYASIEKLYRDLAGIYEATPQYEHFLKEIHFATPLIFGGDPKADPVMIDQAAHAEICRYWNAIYLKEKKKSAQPGTTDNPDDAQCLREGH